MPVLVRPGQAAHFAAEDDPHMIEADLGHQAMEAGPALGGLTAAPLIVIDDQDAGGGPAQLNSPLAELVLERGRFTVLQDLVRGRLADVDDRQPVAVSGPDLVGVQWLEW